jgi:hypothetical protein
LWLLIAPDGSPIINDNIVFFLSIGITGFMAARVIYAYNIWVEVIRISQFFAFVIGVSLVVSIIYPYLHGNFQRGIGGASYQAASYYSAFFFGILGFFTFWNSEIYTFRIFKTRIFSLLIVVLMIGLIFTTILNGGRGAFLLLFIYNLVFFYKYFFSQKSTKANYFKKIIAFAALIIVFISVSIEISSDYLLTSGFNRSIQYLNSLEKGIIDIKGGSSGRYEIYKTAILGIAQSPLIGHGSFAHWDKVISPHNIFLDLFLQFGAPISLIIIFFSTMFIYYNFKSLTIEKIWLLFFFAFLIINLMFSGGYLRNNIFWFFFGVIIFFRKLKN